MHFAFLTNLIVVSSIDEDLLNLVDELDIDSFLKEASEAIDDPDRLAEFIQEKATVAVERFLVRLLRTSCVACNV